jgi:hypothetical protein
MEQPLWGAWLELPTYVGEGGMDPFQRSNGGISSDFWYNEQDNPASLEHANNFVRMIHAREIDAVVNNFDWSICRGKKLVDIGGHHGQLICAIAKKEPEIDCYCLDLPDVISRAPKANNEYAHMIPGDVFDPSTIPLSDAILMKHFLDKCMWNEEETINILQTCYKSLNPKGFVVVADAALPDFGQAKGDNELQLYMDALYMLVGREGQRTELEWRRLANLSGFEKVHFQTTKVPSCSLIVMEK